MDAIACGWVAAIVCTGVAIIAVYWCVGAYAIYAFVNCAFVAVIADHFDRDCGCIELARLAIRYGIGEGICAAEVLIWSVGKRSVIFIDYDLAIGGLGVLSDG
jgi:hypothetical protein